LGNGAVSGNAVFQNLVENGSVKQGWSLELVRKIEQHSLATIAAWGKMGEVRSALPPLKAAKEMS
jgi:hypothetical protein